MYLIMYLSVQGNLAPRRNQGQQRVAANNNNNNNNRANVRGAATMLQVINLISIISLIN